MLSLSRILFALFLACGNVLRKQINTTPTEEDNQHMKGVSNGAIQFESARKIWPLLELLAKIRRGCELYSYTFFGRKSLTK